jgi:biotin carboxyl carrier protein
VRRRLLIAAGLLFLAALVWVLVSRRGSSESEPDPTTAPDRSGKVGRETAVVLDAAAAARADIATTPLRVAGAPGGAGSVGTVELQGELGADPARITTIRAGVPGRLSSKHWPTLGEQLAAGTAVGQVSDAKPLATPRSGIVTRIGAQPGELVQAGQELLQLMDFTAPTARIIWRSDLAGPPPAMITVRPLDGTAVGVQAQLMRTSTEVDSLTRAPVYLYRLATAWQGARPGTPVSATVSDRRTSADPAARASGDQIFVPNAAVVQWNALSWVYVERSARHYVRLRLLTDRATTGGYLVPRGDLVSGDRVVVRGAQQLLSQEFSAQSAGGDDDDR